MRIVEVKLMNFRAYAHETSITIDPLTVIVGRNDAGKSSVLDALDIFFNDADIGNDDCCVHIDSSEVRIACVFEDLPDQLVIDEQYPTTLQAEHLLRADGKLEIVKIYNCTAAKGRISGTFAKAILSVLLHSRFYRWPSEVPHRENRDAHNFRDTFANREPIRAGNCVRPDFSCPCVSV
jgi:hypothetical protein